MSGRREAQQLREVKASLKIQTAYRRYWARRRFVLVQKMAVWVQRRARGRKGRREAFARKAERRAGVLQAWGRMVGTRGKYLRFYAAVVQLQCGFRRRQAKNVLRELRKVWRKGGREGWRGGRLKETEVHKHHTYNLPFLPPPVTTGGQGRGPPAAEQRANEGGSRRAPQAAAA
jgi:hypothetical protein